ncbi:MAG: PAS domain-containing protein [Halobacteriovoraceae bacterium]|nr:PAS domain-containing protein [Halobacteriovoraceae bacterium]
MKNNGERPCIYANQKFEENTGYKRGYAFGKNLAFLQGELTSPETVLFMRQSFRENKAFIEDIINYKQDGTPFLNRILLLPAKDKEIQIYVGFQNDVTSKRGLVSNSDVLKLVKEGEIKHVVNNSLAIILGGYSMLFKNDLTEEKRNEIELKLSTEFQTILEYCLNIEDLSEFENYDVAASLKINSK